MPHEGVDSQQTTRAWEVCIHETPTYTSRRKKAIPRDISYMLAPCAYLISRTYQINPPISITESKPEIYKEH